MKKELNWDMECVPVAIPGEDYERKLYLLAIELLETLEKADPKEEDTLKLEKIR